MMLFMTILESLNLNKVFEKYFDEKGNAPLAGFQSDTLEQDVAKIAEQLELTNEEVIAIYAQYGYVQDKNGHFVRNDDVNLYYKFGALEAKYDVGSTQNIKTLLEEYGFDDPKELEEYGWEKAPGEAGKHGYYRKISAAENIAKITTLYHVNDGENVFIKANKRNYEDHPCKSGDIIKTAFRTQNKRVKDNNDKWVESEEQEEILRDYTILKSID